MSAPFAVQTCPDQQAFDHSAALAFLRARFPYHPAAHVAAATSLPLGTVENWFKGRARPNADAFAMLACCFGPAFLDACLARRPRWLERVLMAERIGAVEQAVQDLRQALDAIEGDAWARLIKSAQAGHQSGSKP